MGRFSVLIRGRRSRNHRVGRQEPKSDCGRVCDQWRVRTTIACKRVRSPTPRSPRNVQSSRGASAISYLPGGHVLVGHRDNSLRVYDARTKKAICCYQLYENPIKDLSVHSSGQFAATCSENDQCSTVIDLVNGITLTTFTMKTAVKSAAFLTVSHDRRLRDQPMVSLISNIMSLIDNFLPALSAAGKRIRYLRLPLSPWQESQVEHLQYLSDKTA